MLQGDADTQLLTLLSTLMIDNGTVIPLPESIVGEDGEPRPAVIPMPYDIVLY